ncbi:VOC family protein [Phaeobacter sp. B1627]|uniref:VOC family protein n=1 Tax=Phaeobacter sp. B1627 TaxID=2583809 RepID=UPI001117DE1C|nr:VOC family protein [Phaeobacter sp. B1627]TNJ43309.1 glyoxalase [Phaeobacter sp. B1627]
MTDISIARTAKTDPQADRLSWGLVELQVTDLARSVAFWTSALGLVERDHGASGVALGTRETTLVMLHPGASKPVAAAYTGMYHVALGVRSQAEFSRILARLLHLRVQVSPTDHLMAKSLYLHDPDGLEIEITLETPERFGRYGDMSRGLILYDADGNQHSGRAPLDVAAELAAAQGADFMAPLADDTYLAHLHFKVAEIEAALEWFEALGFARHLTLHTWGFADMSAGIPGTHRLAMNVWAGQNRPPAPDDMARLIGYEICAHDPSALEHAPLTRDQDRWHGRDPAGAEVTVRSA